MNARSYKTVFSKRLGALVAVGEHASSQGKANGAGSGGGAGASGTLGYIAALTASFALVSLAWAAPAINALPTAGQVVQGAASMSQTASQMTIHQGTQRAAINWQSFNIGAQAKVQVVQPNAQAVLLNRVVGQSPSQIFGQLNANGHVILVNPNGVLFGKDGSVNAGSFTASTLGISDANFMAGNMVYERNGSTAGIVNEGTITTTPGGYVALLGASVSNEGKIETHGGAAYLAAAETVKIPVSGSGRIKLELSPASINAAVNNSKDGSIITQGGQVYMQALALNQAAAQIIQSGSIDTTGEKGGAVNILADGGKIRVSGSVKANSTDGSAGGDVYIGRDKDTNILAAVGDASGARLESKGGFVETSGKFLAVDGTRVMAKDWLLDPDNIDITGDATAATAGYSKIKASDIVANLNIGTSVTIATSPTASLNQPSYKDTPGTGAGSTVSGDGNILVNAVISKTSGGEASLTLLADNGITVNQEIKSTFDKLNVTMKANGSASGASSQGLLINKSIDANGGAINLEGKTTNSVAAVTVAQAAVIQGASVTMVGNSTSGAAIKGTGKVNATAGGVSITGVGNTTGDYAITTNNTIDATGDIEIKTTSAALHGIAIREKVTSSGGKVDLYADVRTSGNGSAINGNFAIKAKNDVTITGKSNGYYTINGLGAIESTEGKVTIDATSTNSSALRLTNAVKAKGDVLIKGAGGNDSGINTGATTTVTSTDGNIEFIGKTTGSGVGVNFTGTTNINATKGTFKVTAESKFSQGIVFQGNTNINAATYTIDAKALGGAAGIYHGSGNTTLTSTNGNSSIKGTSETGRGVFGFNGNINLNANNGSTTTFSSGKGEMRLGWGGGVAVNTNGNVTLGSDQSNFFSQADTTVNSGTLTIKGKSAGHGVAIQDGSGYSTDILVKNGSSLVIVGESTGSGSGIHLLPVGVANKIEMTGQNAGGQKGSITMTGVSAAGVGISTGSTPITSDGGNINLTGTSNGTNGTGLSLGGVIRSGNDTSGGTVTLNGAAKGTGSSVGINNSGSVQGGSVDMTGVAKGTNNAIFSAGAITSTVAGVTIKGTNTSTATNGGGGSTLQGKVTAVGNINLEGHSSNTNATAGNQGLVIQNTVESTGGDITVTGTTTAGGQHAVAITENKVNNTVLSNGSLKVADGKTIDINANTLLINSGSTVNAGTGTVNIKTTSAGNEIMIGGTTANDGQSTTLGSQKLGIDNAELNRITAGNLVIGDTASNGKITVAGATTTAVATGNITLKTGGSIAVNAALTVGDAAGTKSLTLDAGGAITNGASGKLTATNLTLKAGSTIGADGAAIKTNVATANLTSAGDQFLVEDNKVTVAAKTTGNGTINITTTNGTLRVDMVNGVSGIDAGTGNVKLKATSDLSHGIEMPFNVKGKDITVDATANNGTGLGFYGAGGSFNASGSLNLTGTATGTGNGLYTFGGEFKAGTGINITGTSTNGQGVGLDANAKLINTSGDIVIKGTANGTNTEGIGIRGVSIINGENNIGGRITLEAAKGDIFVSDVKPTVSPWNLVAPLTNTITQNGTGDVKLTTVGNGNITVPLIVNNGAGNVIVAAGSDLAAGNGGGGQVKTVAGNTITQNRDGNTYIYSGSAPDTGNLADLNNGFSTLRLTPVLASAQNAQLGTVYQTGTTNNTISGGDKTQVMFRSTATPQFDVNLSGITITKPQGFVDPDQSAINAALIAGYTAANPSGGIKQNGTGPNLFTVGAAAVIGSFSQSTRAPGDSAGSYQYTGFTSSGVNSWTVGAINMPTLKILPATVNPVGSVVPPVGNNPVSRVRTVSGFGGAGAATGVLDDQPANESREVCSDLYPENCECLPSVIPTIEICFAPKRVVANKEEK